MYLSWIGQFDTFFWHSYVSFSMDNLFGNLFYAFQVKYVKTNCYWNCCLGLFNKPYQRWVSPKQLSIPLNKLRWSDLIRSVPDTCGIFKICTAFVLHFVRYLYSICYLIRYKKKRIHKDNSLCNAKKQKLQWIKENQQMSCGWWATSEESFCGSFCLDLLIVFDHVNLLNISNVYYERHMLV